MKIHWKLWSCCLWILVAIISCSESPNNLPLKGELAFKLQSSASNAEWLPILEENPKNDDLVKQLKKAGFIINGQLQVAKLDLEYLSADLPIFQTAGLVLRYELNSHGKSVITVIRGGASYLLPLPASTASDQFFAGVTQIDTKGPSLLFILRKTKEEKGSWYLLQIYGI